MKKHYRHENDCLNCGSELQGKYCHNCGQENLQIKENFGHLMNHAISDYFHFDHQFFHTLKPLLLKPGKLTNEYMAGKRVQYLHPIKMYIFISLVFFLLFFSGNEGDEVVTVHKNGQKKEAIDSAKKQIEKTKQLSKTQKKILEKAVSKGGVINVDSLKDNDDDDDDAQVGGLGTFNLSDTEFPTYQQYLADQKKLSPDEQDSWIERLVEKKKYAYKRKGGNAREAITEEIKHNVPKMMFVLLPLFALILRFSFWKNKKFYVEHLIFSFHLHCFIFLFLIIAMLLQWAIPNHAFHEWLDLLITLGIILYIYKALRAVYHRSRGRTISKMIGMSFIYLIMFTICMIGVTFISVLTAA